MTQVISEKLDVNNETRRPFAMKAERTVHRTTFNPSSAQPGETLYVSIPKLSQGFVYVPNSIAILADLTLTVVSSANSDANRLVINNLGKNLVERVRLTYGGEVIFDLNRSDLFFSYKDLFKLVRERDNMLYEGISSEDIRKLRTNAGNKPTTPADLVKLGTIYGNNYRIPISNEILDKHGCLNMRSLSNTFQFELILANSNSIVTYTANKPYNYSLSNIRLEYETIQSDDLARDIESIYQIGKGFYYENVLLHKTFTVNKVTDTVINEHINVPRRSMIGVLILFVDPYTAGARDSEKFINPDITKIEINIDGMPNKLYSKGMQTTDIWDSISKRYGLTDNITQQKFYNDKYAVWIDLRTYYDNLLHGSGLHLNSTKDGVRLTITRTAASTAGTCTCYMYVVADGLFQVENADLKAILY